MISHKSLVRVRYADTDKMQFVYNGKYLEYFEVGRTELLRSLGLPYRSVEERGYQLPLTEAYLKYVSAAKYDDMLEIEARVDSLPRPLIHINYIIRNADSGNIIVEGYTRHIFIRTESKRAVKPPQFYLDVLKPLAGE